MEELSSQHGVDADTVARLLRLARTSPKACQDQLKALGITQMGMRMRLTAQLADEASEAPASPTVTATATAEAPLSASLAELHRRGADCHALARLARDDAKECKEQLKALGVTQMGARMRMLSELLALVPPSAAAAPPQPSPSRRPGPNKRAGDERRLLAQVTRLKERGNASVSDQNFVAACEAYREGLDVAHAAQEAGTASAELLAPLLVSLHSNLCLCYISLQQWRSAQESAEAVLAMDADNVKALLRRGACLLRQGTPQDRRRGSEEPDDVRATRKAHLLAAKADFMHASRLEPQNRSAREGLKSVHVLMAHNHAFKGFLTSSKPAEERAAAAERPAAVERPPSARPPKPVGAPLFGPGGGLYADVDDDDGSGSGSGTASASADGGGTRPSVPYLRTPEEWASCLARSSARDRLLVVDFTAAWCGPCQHVAPIYEELAARYAWADFVKVDVDTNPDVAAAQAVSAMPTFKLFRAGATVASMQGAEPARLVELIEAHAGPRPPPAGTAAAAVAAAPGRLAGEAAGAEDEDDEGPWIEDVTEEFSDESAGAPPPPRPSPPKEAASAASGEEEDPRRVPRTVDAIGRGADRVVVEGEDLGSDVKGYVRRADGTTTTYFDRGIAHQITPSVLAPQPLPIANGGAKGAVPATADRSGGTNQSAWNSAGTFEERDVSEWARDRLAGMLSLIEYDEDRELVLEECEASSIEGSATIFTARASPPARPSLECRTRRSIASTRMHAAGDGNVHAPSPPQSLWQAVRASPFHGSHSARSRGSLAGGKTKSLFELQFKLQWKATVRVNSSVLCSGALVCECNNHEGTPTLDAKAQLLSQVASRDHALRVMAVAESGLREEVMAVVNRFANELAEKGMHG